MGHEKHRDSRSRGAGDRKRSIFTPLATLFLATLFGAIAASCSVGAEGELPNELNQDGGEKEARRTSTTDAASDDATISAGDAAADMVADGAAGSDATWVDATNDTPTGADAAAAVSEAGAGAPSGNDAALVDANTNTLAEAGPSFEAGASCDFSGIWAKRLTINVSWAPQGITGIIIAPGTGAIKQWIVSTRVRSGSTVTDTSSVCGIALPDFQGTAIAGGETYGVRFPDSMFDSGVLQPFTVDVSINGSGAGATYVTVPTATLLGLTLSDPTTTPWPSTITTAVDSDQDGNPGVTADVAQGAPYSDVPVDILKSTRADRLYLAIRQVTQVSATFTDCDHASGTVTIPQIPNTSSGKYAIDSHVIGCGWAGSTTNCTAKQANFVDSTQPVFTPSGYTQFTSVRMVNGSSCGAVRAALP